VSAETLAPGAPGGRPDGKSVWTRWRKSLIYRPASRFVDRDISARATLRQRFS